MSMMDSGGGGGGGFSFGTPNIGGGISDIFGAIGDFAEASAYKKAAKIAEQNAFLAKESGRIQQAQEARKLYEVTGQEAAATGASGFAAGGSNLDVVRGSLQQSGLQHQLIGLQAGIQEGSFKQQAAAYQGQAQAASAAGMGGIFGGLLSFVGL